MKTLFLILAMVISLSTSAQLSHESSGYNFTAKSWTYFDGDKEIKPDDYKSIIRNDALAYDQYKSHLRSKKWANAFEFTSGALATINLANLVINGDFSWGIVAVNGVLTLPIYLLNKKSSKMLTKVEDSFNDKVSVEFVGDRYGLGIGVRF